MKKRTFLKFALILLLSLSLGLLITACNDKPSTYSVEFITNGGSAVDKLEGATEIAASPDTARPGYTFGGWYAAEDLSGEAVTFPLKLTADAKLYAKWTANEYTITFDYGIAEGGFGDDNKSVVFGEALGELPSPTAPGCDFSGWYKGDAAVNAETIYTWAEDVTLTAAFAGAEYTVTFDYALPEGQTLVGGETQSKAVVFGETIGELPAPTCEGFDLVGWFAGETQYNAESVYNIPGDRTFTAKWSTKVFDVVIHANGGTYTVDGAPVDKIEGKAEYNLHWQFFTNALIREGKNPFSATRTGYTLTGFYTNPECTGDPINTQNYSFTQSIELYAGWRMIEYTVNFEAYSSDGGRVPIDVAPIRGVSIGDTITVPEYPADKTPGYDFFGWYSTYGESLPENPEYLPAGQVEVTAEFIENYSKRSASQLGIYAVVEAKQTVVTLDVNGGVLPEGASSEITVSYNKSGSFPVPTKENYIFDGWYLNLGEEGETRMTNIYGNSIDKWQRTEPALTLKAKWLGQPQTLTFDYAGATSGNTETTRTVNAEAALGTLPVPVKTGHTFGGWFAGDTEYTAASIMPDSALTLTAKWTVNTYTITYDLGGGELPAGAATTKTATYGQAIGELPTPTKTDAVFGGWTIGGSTTVITAETLYTWGTDQVFYATWSDDIYTKGINYVFVPAAGDVPAYYKVGGGTDGDAYVDDTLQEVLIAPTYDDGENGEHPVTTISKYSFKNKTALKNVDIPEGITLIDALAFEAAGLTSVTIPASVKTVGSQAFFNCTSLVTATYAADCKANDVNVTDAFYNCTALKELSLPNGITSFSLPYRAPLDKIVIPNGTTYKSDVNGNSVFTTDTLIWIGPGVTEYTIPDGISAISSGVLSDNIEIFNFNSTATFGDITMTYYNRKKSLKAITVPADHPSYVAVDGVLYFKNADGTTLTLMLYPAGKTDLEFATPENCTSIGKYAFSNMYLTKLTLTAVNNFYKDSKGTILTNVIHRCSTELEIFIDYTPTTADELEQLHFYNNMQRYFSTSVKAIYVHNVDIFKAKTGWSALSAKLFEYPAQP